MAEFRRPLAKWLIVGLFVMFTVVGVALVAATLGGGWEGPPTAFVVLWLAALGWNAYWWLFRVATALWLDGDVLHWEAPLRSGAIPLSDLRAVRPMSFASNAAVFEHTTGRPVLIVVRKGFGAFLDELSAARPDLPVRLGWQGRLAERMPGWSRWRR